MKSYQEFFAELKRRKVFKVAAVYGVVSFGLIQVADPLSDALLLPDAFLTYVVATLMLGFPLALVLAWALEVTPDGVQRTGAAAPGEIEAIVSAPASQRWPAGLLALVGAAALLAGGWWVGTRMGPGDSAGTTAAGGTRPDSLQFAFAEPEADGRPSLAVLPFADMSPEGDQAYFSDGITEEILNTLAKVRELKVAARTSAFAFRGRELDMRAIGDSLGVAYLIEGSVRKSGDELRITAQLIDAADGTHLWSESYDRTLDDVFAIQTEIAEAIAGELRVPLGLDDSDDLVTPTADLEAYDLYLAGRARMRERGDGVAEAIRLYEAAIARDSSWAPAWAGLAESRATLPWYLPGPYADSPWAENLDAADQAAQRALALDPVNSTAWVALGIVHRERWDWQEAEDAFGRALALDPDNVEAHQQYAEYLENVGRLDEALAAARRALQLDRVPIRLNVVALAARLNGRYDEALAVYDEADRIDPEDRLGFLGYNRLRVYVNAGIWDEAREQVGRLRGKLSSELRDARDTWPHGEPPSPEFVVLAGHADWSLGALLWMGLGENERALELFDRYRGRKFGARFYIWEPLFEPLLDEPVLREILRESNLEGRRPRRATP